MSLYLPNISPRIRKDEIERVFRRFGHCSFQPRNGYGFVVYDYRGNAEKALKSLNGKIICGELMNLSWSTNQPKPLQRFVRAAKVQHGRNTETGHHDVRPNFSRSFEDYSGRDKHPNDRRGTHKSTMAHPNDTGTSNCNKLEVEPYNHSIHRHERWEKGGHIIPNLVDNDRWNEKHDSFQRGNDVDGQMRCDRYVPDNANEKGQSFGEPSLVKNKRDHHHDNLISHRRCFKCGAAGHQMRDCSWDASQGNISYHSDRMVDNQVNTKARGNDAAGGPESRSVGRLQSCIMSTISTRHDDGRKPLTVENNGVKQSTSRVLSQPSGKTREKYNRKRPRAKEDRTFVAQDDKKSRISPSPLDSRHMSSQLGKGSRTNSKSQSPVSHFCSASSMSKSRSNRSRSRSKPKSISRSRSPNSSLPISRHQSLSSPQSPEVSLNDPNVEVPSQIHSEERKHGVSVADRTEENLSNGMDISRSHQLKEVSDSKDETPMPINNPELCVDGDLESDRIPQSENAVLENVKLCDPESSQSLKLQVTDVPMDREDVSFSGGDNQLHDNDDNKNITVGEIAAEKQSVDEKFENAVTLEMLKPLGTACKVDLKVPSKNCLSISKEEFHRVLNHYGLKDLEDGEQHLGVEDYFGSARLWPWGFIYYRRLKKGLISTENYARRVAQNSAFSITDKYIRRSSGWSELIDEHF